MASLALLCLAGLASCSARSAPDQQDVDLTVHPAIPLNLDFTRPGLVNPDEPWGWSLQGLSMSGVEVTPSGPAGGLHLSRGERGEPARAVYDLNAPLAGSRLALEASLAGEAAGEARLRVGVLSLAEDWQVSEAWSPVTTHGTCSAHLEIGADSINTQLLLEFSGRGELQLAPLRLTLDGRPVEDGLLPGQDPPRDAEVSWVREHAWPLRSTEPGGPLDDLAVLRPVVGDAKYVLLGESTHGTREFFTLRHRLVRWLTEDQGFTVVAIEDHPHAARAIDHYIHTGEGDVRALVGQLFGVWSRRATVDFVRWLREATEAGEIQVTFTGMDLQVPLDALTGLTDFANRYDPDLALEIEEALGAMHRAWREGRYPRRSADEHALWSAGAERILRWVEERTEDYRSVAGAEATRWALLEARLIWQSAEVSRSDDYRVRDAFMAENLLRIRTQAGPDARVVVWAHNTHVRLDEGAMGECLERRRPGEVVAIGITTQRGSYAAYNAHERRMQSYALFPGPMGSIEYLLHRSGLPLFALDLAPAATAPAAERLRTPHLHRNIGLFPSDLGFYRAPMTAGFDALLFVDRTSATEPMGTANAKAR